MKKTSTFYDFSQRKRFTWWLQSIIFWHVWFYYDFKQKVYCRQVNNVPGIATGGKFYPYPNWLVNYNQIR